MFVCGKLLISVVFLRICLQYTYKCLSLGDVNHVVLLGGANHVFGRFVVENVGDANHGFGRCEV